MSQPKEMSERLNELLERNYDSEKGFKEAANDVKNAQLKDLFMAKARERYDFGHELKSEIKTFGESPDKGSSTKSDLHRSWMNLKAKLSSDGEEAVLEECIRGEKAAVENYNEVIQENNFPPSTENMLIKQRNQIQRSLDEVKNLELRFD